jgi:hypothetical protein
MEVKLTKKSIALICVLTKWDLLVMHSDKDNLEIIREILEVCENVNDDFNEKDGE